MMQANGVCKFAFNTLGKPLCLRCSQLALRMNSVPGGYVYRICETCRVSDGGPLQVESLFFLLYMFSCRLWFNISRRVTPSMHNVALNSYEDLYQKHGL